MLLQQGDEKNLLLQFGRCFSMPEWRHQVIDGGDDLSKSSSFSAGNGLESLVCVQLWKQSQQVQG